MTAQAVYDCHTLSIPFLWASSLCAHCVPPPANGSAVPPTKHHHEVRRAQTRQHLECVGMTANRTMGAALSIGSFGESWFVSFHGIRPDRSGEYSCCPQFSAPMFLQLFCEEFFLLLDSRLGSYALKLGWATILQGQYGAHSGWFRRFNMRRYTSPSEQALVVHAVSGQQANGTRVHPTERDTGDDVLVVG